MSLFSTLSVSLSGIQTSSTLLSLTANNIANANTEGYTKKSAMLSTANLGEAGGGVRLVGFTRESNNVLFTTLSAATSEASYRSTQDDYLQQIQDILGTSSSDNPAISASMTAFINAWTQLDAEPESSVRQSQVVQAAQTLVDDLHRVSSSVESLDRQCSMDISSSLEDLNNYLDQIKDLNIKISENYTSGISSGDLEDERDRLILKVSELTKVTVLPRANNQIALYTTGGYQLVDGATCRVFSYDGTDITASTNPAQSLNETLADGKIEALIDLRRETVPVSTDPTVSVVWKLRAQLDAIAEALTTTVTTATSGVPSFATAYNTSLGVGSTYASYELADAFTLTARTAGDEGNTLSYTLAAGSISGYRITITDGITEEIIDNVDIGSGPFDWTAMASAINTLPSAFVTAEISNAGDLDPALLTLPETYDLSGGIDESTANALASDFFTGTDRLSIDVNSALLEGTAVIKTYASSDVTEALLDSTRSFSADGLSTANSSYSTLVTYILSGFQQSANNISSLSETASGQQSYLQETISNETGVNVDVEMVSIVTLQQSYTASARVMTVVRDLFDLLSSLV